MISVSAIYHLRISEISTLPISVRYHLHGEEISDSPHRSHQYLVYISDIILQLISHAHPCIRHMRVPIWPQEETGSWKEASSNFVSIFVNIRSNEKIMFRRCLLDYYELNRYETCNP